MTALIQLVLRELFDFGMMQTDPNFANYRWQADTAEGTGRLVLLDFGAARDVPPETVASYRRLIEAGLAHDRDRIREIAVETGFLGAAAVAAHRPAVDRIIAAIDDTMARPGAFDFGDRAFVPVVREETKAMIADRATARPACRDIVRPTQDQRHRLALRSVEGAGRCAPAGGGGDWLEYGRLSFLLAPHRGKGRNGRLFCLGGGSLPNCLNRETSPPAPWAVPND